MTQQKNHPQSNDDPQPRDTPRTTRRRTGKADKVEHPKQTQGNDATAELTANSTNQHEIDVAAVDRLEAQGFTTDEAIRLLHASDRLARSEEVRDSEATMRRLRFQRWLVEHGMLDEFTA